VPGLTQQRVGAGPPCLRLQHHADVGSRAAHGCRCSAGLPGHGPVGEVVTRKPGRAQSLALVTNHPGLFALYVWTA